MVQNIHSTKTIYRLFVIAYLVLFFLLISRTAYSESLTDQLISASKNGDTPMVKELIVKGVNVNEKDEYESTAIIYAVTADSNDCVKLLTAIGADVNIKNIVGETPLTIASKKGSIKVVKTLLNSGADANLKGKYGWTALMNAVVPGHINVVDELLSKGADPSIKNDSGTTAIMIAEKLKKPEMIKLFRAAEK
jgi:ankyrin repeat protein